MPWNNRIKYRLKLRDLDIFMVAVQDKSMGKAAVRLSMSQPAVSKAIADLENAFGVRLLNRSQQGVEPTPYGLALIQRGVALFNELRQGVQDIDFLADPTAGELRIGATEPIAAAIVAPVIDSLSRQYPRMRFHFLGSDQSGGTHYQHLNARGIEMSISRISRPPPNEYSTETLFIDSMVVAAGKDSPWTRRRKIELAELVDEPWIQQASENFFGSLVENAFRGSKITPPRLTVTSNSPMLRNELLATGRYLTVVSGFSLRLPRKHPFLKALSVELPNMRHPVSIITLKGRSLSPLAELFAKRIRAFIKPLAKS